MELSKKDKKTARQIIEAGLQKEFAKGLFDADTILTEWKNKAIDNREAYMTGSKYLLIVAAQLSDGIISENDLNEFSEEARLTVKRIAEL
jgi:hypothetical protein